MLGSYARGGKRSELSADEIRFAARWHALAYSVAILPFVLLVVLAAKYPNSHRPIPDWESPLADADAAWEKGDLAKARYLYLKAARFASWEQHWQGIVAAACGLKRLDSISGFYFTTHDALIRAMIVAERHRSRHGLTAVADAFGSAGRHEAAAMVLAKIRPHWPAESGDCLDNLLQRCRSPGLKGG